MTTDEVVKEILELLKGARHEVIDVVIGHDKLYRHDWSMVVQTPWIAPGTTRTIYKIEHLRGFNVPETAIQELQERAFA